MTALEQLLEDMQTLRDRLEHEYDKANSPAPLNDALGSIEHAYGKLWEYMYPSVEKPTAVFAIDANSVGSDAKGKSVLTTGNGLPF